MTPDYKIAMAAAHDAGSRNAKANGRKKWNAQDWRVACATFEALMGIA